MIAQEVKKASLIVFQEGIEKIAVKYLMDTLFYCIQEREKGGHRATCEQIRLDYTVPIIKTVKENLEKLGYELSLFRKGDYIEWNITW
jgi:hypothetical protein